MSDRHHPGRRAAPAGVEPGCRTPDLQQYLLRDLLRLRGITQNPANDPVSRASQPVVQLLEGCLIAPRHKADQAVEILVSPLLWTRIRATAPDVTSVHMRCSVRLQAQIGRQGAFLLASRATCRRWLPPARRLRGGTASRSEFVPGRTHPAGRQTRREDVAGRHPKCRPDYRMLTPQGAG